VNVVPTATDDGTVNENVTVSFFGKGTEKSELSERVSADDPLDRYPSLLIPSVSIPCTLNV
jgi:hypothetical protein